MIFLHSGFGRILALVAPLLFAPALQAEVPSISDSQWKTLSKGDVILLGDGKQKTGESKKVTAAILVNQPVSSVRNVLNDTESAPKYIADLKSAKVIEKGSNYQLVEQQLKIAPLPMLTYVIKHQNVSSNRIEFERTSGDLKDVRGFWEFRSTNNGNSTLLIYSLQIDPGIPVPTFLMKSSMKKNLPNALRGVRDRTESLAGSGR